MWLQYNWKAVPFLIAATISGVLALLAWGRRPKASATAFAVMVGGEAAWAACEALELVVKDFGLQSLLINLRVLGAVTTIVGMTATVLSYTGHHDWLRPRRLWGLFGFPLAFVLVAWTNPLHQSYWTSITPLKVDGVMVAVRGYGPGFWIHFCWCYALVAASWFLLAEASMRTSGVYRAQALVMLFGVTFPWVVSMLDICFVFGRVYMDVAAMTFAVTGVAFVPALFRFSLLDLAPAAWAAVVDQMGDPVVAIDPAGRIADLNPAARRLIERPAVEVVGMHAGLAWLAWPELSARLYALGGPGEPAEESAFELDPPAPGGAPPYSARITRLGRDGTAGWLLVLRDISSLRQAEEQRAGAMLERAARAEAEAVNRAKDHFLAALSHELRTPLTPVLATASMMLEDPATPSELRPVFEMICRNVAVEARLIDDLLDLARIRGGKLLLRRELVDSHELVRRVVEICAGDLRAAHVELSMDLAAREPYVDADPVRLQQVLWNLVKNAIKFTPAYGSVAIRSSRPEAPREGAEAGELVIQVIDTGIGIEPDVLPRIFDRFEQEGFPSGRRHGGLGLGLTISRSIAEQHGARLEAASSGRGRGSTFTLRWPAPAGLPVAALGGLAPPATSPAPAQGPTRGGAPPLRILLVEDNSDTRENFRAMLVRRGHAVTAAGSLAEALRLAPEVELDLVVSDLDLPDGSGLDLMTILSATRGLPGIALSGFGAERDVELSRARGFALHLTKPITFRRLEQAIREVAGSGQLAPGAVEA